NLLPGLQSQHRSSAIGRARTVRLAGKSPPLYPKAIRTWCKLDGAAAAAIGIGADRGLGIRSPGGYLAVHHMRGPYGSARDLIHDSARERSRGRRSLGEKPRENRDAGKQVIVLGEHGSNSLRIIAQLGTQQSALSTQPRRLKFVIVNSVDRGWTEWTPPITQRFLILASVGTRLAS